MNGNTLIIIAALTLTGCASNGGFQNHVAGTSSATEYVRDSRGQTQFRIRDGSVFAPDGNRVARIDSTGRITNSSGATIGRISSR